MMRIKSECLAIPAGGVNLVRDAIGIFLLVAPRDSHVTLPPAAINLAESSPSPREPPTNKARAPQNFPGRTKATLERPLKMF
jgi:hypothetical protein